MMSPSTLKNAPEDAATSSTPTAGESMIRKVVRECCAMGLCSSESGSLILTPETLDAFPKAQFDPERMRALLVRLLLRIQPDANKDLGYVLSWFLEQDPVTFGVGKGDRRAAIMSELHHQGVSNQLQITNNSPLDNFSYWTVYLGMGWKMNMGGTIPERLVPDPTLFLRRQLPVLLPLHETVSLFWFMEQLAASCPIFRGGQWHSDLEGRRALPSREAQYLSPTLGFALKRLEEQGHLKLIFRGDAESLLVRFDGQTQNLSHLERQV